MKLETITGCNVCPLGVIITETDGAGCQHPYNGNDEGAIFEDNNPTALPDYVPDVCNLVPHGELLLRADKTKILSRDAAERLAEIAEYEAANPRGCVCENNDFSCLYCVGKPEPL